AAAPRGGGPPPPPRRGGERLHRVVRGLGHLGVVELGPGAHRPQVPRERVEPVRRDADRRLRRGSAAPPARRLIPEPPPALTTLAPRPRGTQARPTRPRVIRARGTR